MNAVKRRLSIFTSAADVKTLLCFLSSKNKIVLCEAGFNTTVLFSSIIAPGKYFFQSCMLVWHILLIVLLLLLLGDMLLKWLATQVRNQVK